MGKRRRSMLAAKGVLHKDFTKGETAGELFVGFVEHMGRHIYGGLYDKGHPLADEEGSRKDVLALVRELSMPLMRYPGGNFVSGYDWRSGIGPKEKRTPHFDPAWEEKVALELALEGFSPEKLLDHFLISAEEPMLTNSPEKENIVPRKTEEFSLAEGKFFLTMPARSWGLFRFRIK